MADRGKIRGVLAKGCAARTSLSCEASMHTSSYENKNLFALLVFIASPIALFASSEMDRKIEDAAKASYNYQTVLEDHVRVKAHEGVVTLTGTVQDKDDKALAEDTVKNLPGVTSVKNEITIKPIHPVRSRPRSPRLTARS